jgi:hypothetical protein
VSGERPLRNATVSNTVNEARDTTAQVIHAHGGICSIVGLLRGVEAGRAHDDCNAQDSRGGLERLQHRDCDVGADPAGLVVLVIVGAAVLRHGHAWSRTTAAVDPGARRFAHPDPRRPYPVVVACSGYQGRKVIPPDGRWTCSDTLSSPSTTAASA